jgi:hypothetical protein
LADLCLRSEELLPELKKMILAHYKQDQLDHRLLQVLGRLATSIPNGDIIPRNELISAIKNGLKTKKIDIPHETQAKLFYYLFELQNLADEDSDVISSYLKESIKYLAYTKNFSGFVEEILPKLITRKGISDNATTEVFKILFNLKSGCPIEASLMYVQELAKVTYLDFD